MHYRIVYDVQGERMQMEVHALSIKVGPPLKSIQ